MAASPSPDAPTPGLRAFVAPTAATALGLGLAAWCWRGHTAELRPVTVGLSLLALAACAIAIPLARRGAVGLRLAVVVAMVTAGVALLALRTAGIWPFAIDVWCDARYAGLLGAGTLAGAIGLVAGRLWARWLILALGLSGVGCGALNLVPYVRAGVGGEAPWMLALGLVGGLAIALHLGHPAVVARFQRRDADALWSSTAPLVRVGRAAAMAGFVAGAMCVLYGFGQPVVPATAPWALALAPLVLIGAALVVARRTAGVLVLGLAGLGLAAVAAATLAGAPVGQRGPAAYYACAWIPAAALGLAAALLALRRA
jgi:hypothetical protein